MEQIIVQSPTTKKEYLVLAAPLEEGIHLNRFDISFESIGRSRQEVDSILNEEDFDLFNEIAQQSVKKLRAYQKIRNPEHYPAKFVLLADPYFAIKLMVIKLKELLPAEYKAFLEYHIDKSRRHLNQKSHKVYWNYVMSLLKIKVSGAANLQYLDAFQKNELFKVCNKLITDTHPKLHNFKIKTNLKTEDEPLIIERNHSINESKLKTDLLALTSHNSKSGRSGFAPYLGKKEVANIGRQWFDIKLEFSSDIPDSMVTIKRTQLLQYLHGLFYKHLKPEGVTAKQLVACTRAYWPLEKELPASAILKNFYKYDHKFMPQDHQNLKIF